MLSFDTYSITTRHSASLYPWQCQPGLPPVGPVIGIDHLAGGTKFCFDPWALYNRRIITGPNMIVLGQVGKGKSSFVKTFSGRQMLFGRSAYICDPKGEYRSWANAMEVPTVSLSPGSGAVRINPLDTTPFAGLPASQVRLRQVEMVQALAASGMGRDLAPAERIGIAIAVSYVGDSIASPTIGDVVNVLLSPPGDLAYMLKCSTEELRTQVREPALELLRLYSGDLAGMFDGPTNIEIDWDGKGLVIDLSAVFGSDALAPVMICAGTWLAQVTALGRYSGRKSLIVLDEAWAVLRLKTVTRWLQATAKLARQYGVALVLVAHRVSDLANQADANTEQWRQAQGLLADCETRVIYAQPDSETDSLRNVLGLSEKETDRVLHMPPYQALWRVGRQAAVVEHVLSAKERSIVDTDSAMVDARKGG
ncbi:MAG: hypothetical protein M1115_11240 [Actinobacteria bacterium]|nr:hypothetical protein [Actinomycetota bacterium]